MTDKAVADRKDFSIVLFQFPDDILPQVTELERYFPGFKSVQVMEVTTRQEVVGLVSEITGDVIWATTASADDETRQFILERSGKIVAPLPFPDLSRGRLLRDEVIVMELEKAGIVAQILSEPLKCEIDVQVKGQLMLDGKEVFSFVRGYNHWQISGDVSMRKAIALYGDPVCRRELLVQGHGDRPRPDQVIAGGYAWARRVGKDWFIPRYHATTPRALSRFVQFVRREKLAE